MGQKNNNLIQGLISDELKTKLDTAISERNHQIGKAIEAMVRLWISLPPDTQARLYSKTLTESAFIDLVRQIVADEIQAGQKAAQVLVESRKHKRGQGG